jgi:hypothetical protein
MSRAAASTSSRFRLERNDNGMKRHLGAFAVAATALAVAVGLSVAPRAVAAFGENYGLFPINSGPGTLDVPAIPGAEHLFWAGVCDRAAAPAAGADLAPLGGIGTMPATATAPSQSAAGQGSIVDVPLLGSVRDCIDWRLGLEGTNGSNQPHDLWQPPPSWRLADIVQAGGRADGTATFGFVRDGDTDNFIVDLPPGFVGNPGAVPKCTADQFAVKPQLCPPRTQVGVLTIRHFGAPVGGSNFGNAQNIDTVPVFNLEPRAGNAAELGLVRLTKDGRVTARLIAKARTNDDFGVRTFIGQIPGSALPLVHQQITLWGVPWDAVNDVWRAPLGMSQSGPCAQQPGTGPGSSHVIPPGGLSEACRESYDPSWGEIQPFIALETDCNPSPVTRLASDAYQFPGSFIADGSDPPGAVLTPRNGDPDPADPNWKRYESPAPAVEGCEKLPFAPDIDFGAVSAADAPTGLAVDLSVPQNNSAPLDPPAVGAGPAEVADYVSRASDHWRSDQGLATAHLKDTVVTLPPGLTVNPSSATGLQGCSDSQIGVRGKDGGRYLFNNGDPFNSDGGADGAECPGGSRIGTARVQTPLLEDPLTGEVVLGAPHSTDPRSGEMFRMFLVLRDKDRGLIAKIFGSATADGTVGEGGSGQLRATFRENPEVPFDDLELDFRGGQQGVLATPRDCAAHTWTAAFTPWSSVGAPPPGVADSPDSGALAVDRRCGMGFTPDLVAGTDTNRARARGTFSFRFGRADGQPRLAGLTATLPTGLLASVRDLPLCTNGQANAGACPLGSQIGVVDAKAGAGDPFVLERKGRVYLTEGYKGGEYGLAVKIRPVAGPFRGATELSPIVVRQAIHVDRATSRVTAISDPFPQVWHGVPLRVREITVLVDRDNFMLNPSGCSPRQIDAAIAPDRAPVANTSNRFQASDCRELAFKPRLALRLTGRRQVRTGRHPGIRAVVRQRGIPEAGIRRAEVRLPKSLALDVDNAQALCEFEDGTKPDLENHCPQGSIVGRARAVTPLLNRDLVGNVYFVKNVRIDPDTGNEIRTLPMIVVALRGEVAINLRGTSDVKGGKLVSVFARVPDAPIARFNLNIRGGGNGIIAVTRTRRALINLCTRPKRHIAESDMDGQNRKRFDRNIRMRTPCPKANRDRSAGPRGKGKGRQPRAAKPERAA